MDVREFTGFCGLAALAALSFSAVSWLFGGTGYAALGAGGMLAGFLVAIWWQHRGRSKSHLKRDSGENWNGGEEHHYKKEGDL